ncbi:MAG: hypothetical protein ACKN81_15665, partial [Pirellulaceae bacterium]
CIFYVAIKRLIVDDLGRKANVAIHRVAAVATKEVACNFYVATIARSWMTWEEAQTKPSTAWPRWLQKRWHAFSM